MDVHLPAPAPFAWSAAHAADGPPIAELRAAVLRTSLERLGRYDDVGVRQRFLTAFEPALTRVLRAPDGVAGSVALRPAADGIWIEHFYLLTAVQGQGIGTAVVRAITIAADATATTLRLNVLAQSDARRLYERHGFTLVDEDDIDVYFERRPQVVPGTAPRRGALTGPLSMRTSDRP